MQMQAMMKKQEQLQLALQQKKIEEQMIEAELEKSYQNKQIDNSNTRYVQHVALPNSNPDEKTYMYSTISLDVRLFLGRDYWSKVQVHLKTVQIEILNWF